MAAARLVPMPSNQTVDIGISGLGVTTAIGQGQTAFTEGLLQGRHAFGFMARPGRNNGTRYLGAELGGLDLPACLPPKVLRTATLSGQAALATLHEAWTDACLDQIDPSRIGLVIGGSNFQQRELMQIHQTYAGRSQFLRPTYGLNFMDSDMCGLCTQQFRIQGFAYTVGGASASGQLAVIQALQAVQAGQVDVCISLGALMDLSHWECQALRTLGAMGSDRYANQPDSACRPFDCSRDGFIYGEACGAVVIERIGHILKRGQNLYASIPGWAVAMDANRNPDPSREGEVRAIQTALGRAAWTPQMIDYINPHGTGSSIGDETEVAALKTCCLSHAFVNATKSLTGHGLCAAGIVEIIATLVQMRTGCLHPTRNLHDPIDEEMNWVRERKVTHQIKRALSLSMGFGGINTAVCLQTS